MRSVHKNQFLYTNTKHGETDIKNSIIYNHFKENEIFRYKLGTHVKNLHAHNYKMLIREIKDLSKQRDIPCSQIRRLNIEKMSILSKLMYSFNAISIRIPAKFFVGIGKPILKLI